jgi:DNA-binding IclR family transcriptional regulator
MAFLPEATLSTKLNGYEFVRFTDRTLVTKDQFIAALDTVRTDGFAYNDREEYEHFHRISVPIFNYLSEPIVVLNIWTTHPQHTKSERLDWSRELVASTQRVTLRPRAPSRRSSQCRAR